MANTTFIFKVKFNQSLLQRQKILIKCGKNLKTIFNAEIIKCENAFVDLKSNLALLSLDPDILYKKLKFYRFDELSDKWYKSFLSGRAEIVKIGDKISSSQPLTSGIPQGGDIIPSNFLSFMSQICRNG